MKFLPRPRFSLRTLLLLLLLVASSATLWWNWDPWTVAYTIEEPFPIHEATFSEDGQSVLVHYDDFAGPSAGNVWSTLDVRDASNGTRRSLLRVNARPGRPFQPSKQTRGNFALLLTADVAKSALFDLRTGIELDSKGAISPDYSNYELGRSTFLYPVIGENVENRHILRLARLPSFEKIRDFPGNEYVCYGNGKWFWHDETTFHVIDEATGSEVTVPALREKSVGGLRGDYFVWTPNYYLKIIHVRTGIQSNHIQHANLYDMTRDGKFVWIREVSDNESHMVLYPFAAKLENPIVRLKSDCIKRSDDETLLISDEAEDVSCLDPQSFRRRWTRKNFSNHRFDTRNKLLLGCLYEHPGDRICILDAQTGTTLMDFGSLRWRQFGLARAELKLSPDARTLIAWQPNNDKLPFRERAVVFKLRRPWQWYGILQLPEFWIMLLLSILLLWSIWPRRRIG